MSVQSRHWLITENNPKMSDEEKNKFFDNLIKSKDLTYVVFQKEIGKETKTPHYQIYVQTKKKTTRVGLIGLGFGECHIDFPFGGSSSARDYCSKSDTRCAGPWSGGEFNRNIGGASTGRTDKKRKQSHVSEDDVKRVKNKSVSIYYGPPGTGKTTLAARELGTGYYNYPSKSRASAGRWLGQYAGEHSVLIDEWDFDDFHANELALLLDNSIHNITTQMGGKSEKMLADKIILCTNNSEEKINLYLENNPKILRRITELRKFQNTPFTNKNKIKKTIVCDSVVDSKGENSVVVKDVVSDQESKEQVAQSNK